MELRAAFSKTWFVIPFSLLLLIVVMVLLILSGTTGIPSDDRDSSGLDSSASADEVGDYDADSGWEVYSGDGFTFSYPSAFTTSSYQDEDGRGVRLVYHGITQRDSGREDLFDGVVMSVVLMANSSQGAEALADARKPGEAPLRRLLMNNGSYAYFYDIQGDVSENTYFIDLNGSDVLKIVLQYAGEEAVVEHYLATMELVIDSFDFAN